MSIPKSPRTVVTGAASGLGRAFCLELATRGSHLVLADRDLAGAEATLSQVVAAGGRGAAMACDVSRAADVEALAAAATRELGEVDLMINNAGVAVAGPVGDIPLADWEWITGVNYWGVVHGCHFFLPAMKARGRGHVLNVASSAGLVSAPEMGPYNMTKAAVVALSETLAAELEGSGVGVTVLCPTFFQTGILDNSRRSNMRDGMDGMVRKLMSGASLQADGVARAALAGCESDQLFVVPMSDGLWGWRLKRLSPELFVSLVPKALRFLRSRS